MKKIGKLYRHEVLDRCMLICDILSEQIYDHPAMTEEMNEKINDAVYLIYQVGCISADDYCKKCGRTALAPIQSKKKKMVCLYCSNKQRRSN